MCNRKYQSHRIGGRRGRRGHRLDAQSDLAAEAEVGARPCAGLWIERSRGCRRSEREKARCTFGLQLQHVDEAGPRVAYAEHDLEWRAELRYGHRSVDHQREVGDHGNRRCVLRDVVPRIEILDEQRNRTCVERHGTGRRDVERAREQERRRLTAPEQQAGPQPRGRLEHANRLHDAERHHFGRRRVRNLNGRYRARAHVRHDDSIVELRTGRRRVEVIGDLDREVGLTELGDEVRRERHDARLLEAMESLRIEIGVFVDAEQHGRGADRASAQPAAVGLCAGDERPEHCRRVEIRTAKVDLRAAVVPTNDGRKREGLHLDTLVDEVEE